jgi:hypothetical protein
MDFQNHNFKLINRAYNDLWTVYNLGNPKIPVQNFSHTATGSLGSTHNPSWLFFTITNYLHQKNAFWKLKNNKKIIVLRTNTTQYQNSVLQKSIRIVREGYVNKYTNPRRIETTTAAYHVEIQAKLPKTRPKTKKLTPSTTTATSFIQTPTSTQCPLCVFKAKNINW